MTLAEMATEKPTVLFVPGNWHTPTHFVKIREVFESAGYPTICKINPSIESVTALGFQEDTDAVRQDLESLIEDEGKDVIVVGHSYSGLIISEAADEKFAKKTRLENGEKGGILHMVYMCAFLLLVGKSIVDALGDVSTDGMFDVDDNGLCMMTEPASRFYQDLSEEEQQKAISELKKAPVNLSLATQTKAGYLHHPVTYLYCENDQALFYSMQQRMVENARAAGVKIATEHCSASHSPHLSMPQRVLETIQSLGK